MKTILLTKLPKNFLPAGAILLGGGLIGIAAHAATELARVNSTVITLEDFEKKYKENLQFFQTKPPTRKGVLDDLIKRELGVQQAKQMGLDKDPDVQDRMNSVLYQAYLERKLAKEFQGIKLSPADSKAFYEKNPEIRTSHIFIPLRPGAPAAEEKAAMDKMHLIQAELRKDHSFSEVAQQYSQGAEAPMGGDVDYRSKDRLDPAYYEAALKLHSPGKVSDIVRSQFGLHIIRLTAIRPWEDADQATANRLALEEKRQAIFDHHMTQLRAQSKVSVKGDLLKE